MYDKIRVMLEYLRMEKEGTLETLLAAYPDMIVSTERMGDIWMRQNLGVINRRYTFSLLWDDNSDQDQPSVVIAIQDEPQDGNYKLPSSFLVLNSSGSDSISITKDAHSGIVLSEIMSRVKVGFDIFTALRRIPFSERQKFRGRAYHAFMDYKNSYASEEGTLTDQHPLEIWKYMDSMVRKRIVEINGEPCDALRL